MSLEVYTNFGILPSCHLECDIKRLISQSAGFDVYSYSYNFIEILEFFIVLSQSQALSTPLSIVEFSILSAFGTYKH